MPTPLAHTVFFTLHDPTKENVRSLIDGCHEHLSGHPGQVFFAVGSRASDLQREVNDLEFDVSLHMAFESREAHDAYQPHERHERFIEQCQALWKSVRVFDSNLDVRAS